MEFKYPKYRSWGGLWWKFQRSRPKIKEWSDFPLWEEPYLKLGNKKWEWSLGEYQEYIYFLYAPEVNRVKIGSSANYSKRVNDVSSHSPCNLELLLVISTSQHLVVDIERVIQLAFCRYWYRKEWFEYTGKLKNYVEGIIMDLRHP